MPRTPTTPFRLDDSDLALLRSLQTALADDLGRPRTAADVVRLGLRRLAAEHLPAPDPDGGKKSRKKS